MTSLRHYLVSVAVLLVLLICAAAAALVYQVDSYGRKQSEQQLLATARALSQAVDGELQRYEATLRSLAASESLQERDWKAFDRRARRLLAGPGAWIVVGDRDGRQLVNTRLPPGAPLPQGRAPAEMWRALDAGRTHVCDFAHGSLVSDILCVDIPVMEGGRARYHLSVIMLPEQLRRITDRQRLDHGGIGTILDRSGVVLWRNIAPDRFVGRPATPQMRAALARSDEGTGPSRSLEGNPTVVAYSRSPYSGWTFVVALPRSQLAAGLNRALALGGLSALALLLVGGFAGLMAARRITGAVDRLCEATLRIKDGSAPAFAPSGLAEIDAVGRALDEAIAERDLSEERFDLAQEVGGIGAWDWDVLRDEGRVSEPYRAMHGLSGREGPLRMADILAVIHPDDLEGYEARLSEARGRAEPSTNEYRVVHPDGSVRWIAAKGRPLTDEQGRYVRAVGIVRDITAEREAERALRESEEDLKRLNALLADRVEARTAERDRLWTLSPDPFVVSDTGGVWLAASPAWSELLGWPVEELVGHTVDWLTHPDDLAHVAETRAGLARGEIARELLSRLRSRDGDYRWLSWTCVPEGERIYSVARDVTEERERAEALRKAEDALRQSQKMESIGQITGGLAHDFNNLLSPILGTLDLLHQRGLPEPRSERLVAGAIEAAERARMLVQRLLAFARRQPLQPSAVDVARLLADLAPLLASTVGPGIRIELVGGEGVPPALVDSNQLELAVLNLAVNARDAMPDGGTLEIEVRPERVGPGAAIRGGEYVLLSLADTGTGMPPSVLERAIEPFFSTKGTGRGTGLGLSMVHGLVAQLGGDMRIESELGRGTTVRLWLPVARVAEEAPPPSPGAARITPQRGTALLVDDESLVRSNTAQMLAEIGYGVVEAASAAEAIRILEGAAGIDVLVTDHFMPGTTGTELARTVRRDRPNLPILIVSGYADVADIAPDLPRLSKPFRQAELAQALAAIDA